MGSHVREASEIHQGDEDRPLIEKLDHDDVARPPVVVSEVAGSDPALIVEGWRIGDAAESGIGLDVDVDIRAGAGAHKGAGVAGEQALDPVADLSFEIRRLPAA